MNRTTVATVLAAALLLGTGACSTSAKVGSDRLKDFAQQSGAPRLGEETAKPATHPPAAVRATQRPRPAATTAPQRTTAPVATVRPRVSQGPAHFTIDINGDNTTSTQFNPANAAVYTGTIVTWVNRDSVPRGIKSSDGGATFSSPSIPPGKSFTWTASRAGQIQYSDTTRPYAVASLTVQAHG